MIDIELRERLRRRRDELRLKLEMITGDETGGDDDSDDPERRMRELTHLDSLIQQVTLKAQGNLKIYVS